MRRIILAVCLLITSQSFVLGQSQSSVPITPDNLSEMKLLNAFACSREDIPRGISGNSQLLALHCNSKQIDVYNLISREQIVHIDTGQKQIQHPLTLNYSGDIVISVARELTLWDVLQEELLLEYSPYRHGRVVLSPDGTLLGIWEVLRTRIRVVNWETQDYIAGYDEHSSDVYQVIFLSNGTQIVSRSFDSDVGDPDEIRVWDINSQETIHLLQLDGITGMAYSPISNLIVFEEFRQNIHILNAETFDEVTVIPLSLGCCLDEMFGFNSAGTMIAAQQCIEYDCTLQTWNVFDAELVSSFAFTYPENDGHYILSSVDFSGDEGIVTLKSDIDWVTRRTELWNMDSAEPSMTIVADKDWLDEFGSSQFSPDMTSWLVQAGNHILIYGIPTENRPAYQTVPGFIFPSSVNLRAEPSLDAETIGIVEEGVVAVGGRDETGRFVYLVDQAGWILSEYVDLWNVTISELPVKQ